jgi:hypothetical protein
LVSENVVTLFKIAAGINTVWGLAGCAIIALLYFTYRQRRKAPAIAWGAIVGIIVLPLVLIIGWLQLQRERMHGEDIYHLRVTVLDPENTPINQARVWSSTDAVPKKVDGGWEFSIPAGSKPVDGKLTVYAQVENAYWQGQKEVRLTDDFYPTTTLQLRSIETAQVRGIVVDSRRRAIAGAQVSVVGYPKETVTTQQDGNFVLAAHAADGQPVWLHAEKHGRAVDQWQAAGNPPATLLLEGGGRD